MFTKVRAMKKVNLLSANILIIYNIYFEIMVSQIYSAELQLNKAYTSDSIYTLFFSPAFVHF